MKLTESKLREIIREELQKEDFGMAAKQMPKFSSKEAKTIIGPRCRIFSNGQFYTPWT